MFGVDKSDRLSIVRLCVPQYIHIGSHYLASLVRDVGDHSMRNVAQWVETNAVFLGTVILVCLRLCRYVSHQYCFVDTCGQQTGRTIFSQIASTKNVRMGIVDADGRAYITTTYWISDIALEPGG